MCFVLTALLMACLAWNTISSAVPRGYETKAGTRLAVVEPTVKAAAATSIGTKVNFIVGPAW